LAKRRWAILWRRDELATVCTKLNLHLRFLLLAFHIHSFDRKQQTALDRANDAANKDDVSL
jgi:hypothetical protein